MAKQQSSLVEQFLKPLIDHLGLNGAAALQATQHPQKSQTEDSPVSEAQLRKQGWSESDIQRLRKQGKTDGSGR